MANNLLTLTKQVKFTSSAGMAANPDENRHNTCSPIDT